MNERGVSLWFPGGPRSQCHQDEFVYFCCYSFFKFLLYSVFRRRCVPIVVAGVIGGGRKEKSMLYERKSLII